MRSREKCGCGRASHGPSKSRRPGAWEGLALRWEGGGEAVQGQNRLPRRAGPAHRFQGAIGKAPLEEFKAFFWVN